MPPDAILRPWLPKAGSDAERRRWMACVGRCYTASSRRERGPASLEWPRTLHGCLMASASQLKALLQSYVEGDDDRFLSVAMQVAAHEARLGHGKLATELRETIDEAKRRRGAAPVVSISQPRGELGNLLQVSHPKARASDLILEPRLSDQIARVIKEQRKATRILEQGLSPRRKLLLVGPPGTGKTLTASVLAGELGLPLLEVRLDGLITRFMGKPPRS